MSWVTDVLLCVNLEEKIDEDSNLSESCEALDNIKSWLEQHEMGKLDNLSKHVVSGGKAMQCCVYGGAFDHLAITEFIAIVKAQQWKMPESLMLLTKDEEQEEFSIHYIR